ncbi:hypothetical protein CKF59_05235 [Psittacicella gerlachiana]|uniref:Uncharacterized protein n=2 Tax=Psittacicella gerlachiana TaxID=2028574 RepID=A0A3A1YAD0_9GAMM|nr:hypothetical protein CKF59_05235 [Psittacicella gerlachiana]
MTIVTLIVIFIYWSFLPQIATLVDKIYNRSLQVKIPFFIAICLVTLWLTINLSPSGVPPFIYSNF